MAFLATVLAGCTSPASITDATPEAPDKVYSGVGFTFSYPSNLIADGLGLWSQEDYTRRIYPPMGCETCQIPNIEIRTSATDKTLEDFIVSDFVFGDSTFEQITNLEFVKYERITIGSNDFIKIRVHENFAVTGYYTKVGNRVVAFRTHFDNWDNQQLLKIIETLSFQEESISESEIDTDKIFKNREVSFGSCGKVEEYKRTSWYKDFTDKINGIDIPADGVTTKSTIDNIKEVCLSSGKSLVIAIFNPDYECGRGKLFRYFTKEKVLQEATILGELDDCKANFGEFSKREDNIIPVMSHQEENACIFTTYFDYNFIENTVDPTKNCNRCLRIINGQEILGMERCVEI